MINAYRLVKKHHNVRLVLAGTGGGEPRAARDAVPAARGGGHRIATWSCSSCRRRRTCRSTRCSAPPRSCIQKSVREGFGLGAGRGDVEGQAGGRRRRRRARAADRHDVTGYTVHSVEGAAFRIRHLLNNPELIAADGRGRARARPPVVPDHAPPRRLPGAAHSPHALSERRRPWRCQRPNVVRQLARVPPVELAVGLLTYNSAATRPGGRRRDRGLASATSPR